MILDEIDGIDNKETVDMIMRIVKQPLHAPRTPANKNDIPLTRPLICICNDQFAPQLRELRQHAQVFVFAPPSQVRLVNRLKQIISLEGAQLSSSILMMLCNSNGTMSDYAYVIIVFMDLLLGNDIRSCLNTLQFATLQCKNEVQKQVTGICAHYALGTSALYAMLLESDGYEYKHKVSHALQNMVIHGLKDNQRDAFQIWKSIFKYA